MRIVDTLNPGNVGVMIEAQSFRSPFLSPETIQQYQAYVHYLFDDLSKTFNNTRYPDEYTKFDASLTHYKTQFDAQLTEYAQRNKKDTAATTTDSDELDVTTPQQIRGFIHQLNGKLDRFQHFAILFEDMDYSAAATDIVKEFTSLLKTLYPSETESNPS